MHAIVMPPVWVSFLRPTVEASDALSKGTETRLTSARTLIQSQ